MRDNASPSDAPSSSSGLKAQARCKRAARPIAAGRWQRPAALSPAVERRATSAWPPAQPVKRHHALLPETVGMMALQGRG